MAAQDDRFKNMVESSLDWFWEFDENADFTYVSPRIKDLLGYDPEEIIGLNAFDLMDDEEAARVRIHFDPLAEITSHSRIWKTSIFTRMAMRLSLNPAAHRFLMRPELFVVIGESTEISLPASKLSRLSG